MANNIYRRQPVPHKLPTDYASIDNVKYFNINNVSGLQVYDNPLVAAQNSTYNCKNVYRDELGNLTVRPAVHYSMSDTNTMLTTSYLTWYKETRLGIIYIYKWGGSNTSTAYDSVNIQPKGSSSIWQKLILHGESISVEETEDGVYILLNVYDASNLPAKTRLEFWKVNNDGTVEQVTGEIQLNNVLKPDLSLYNILNDKIYTDQTIINSDDSKNKYEVIASILAEVNAQPFDIIKILKYKFGVAIFYYEGNILKALLLKESGLITNIEIGTYQKYTSDWRIFDPFCIKEYPDGEYFDLTFMYSKSTNTYITEVSVGFSGKVTTISDEKAIGSTVANANGVSYTLLDAQPAYDGYYIGIIQMTTVDSSIQHYNMRMMLVKQGSVVKLFSLSNTYDSIRNYPCYNIFCSDKFVMFGQIPYDYQSYSAYSCRYEAVEYKTDYRPAKSGLFGTQHKYDLAHFKQLSLPSAIVVSNLRYSDSSGSFQGSPQYTAAEYYAPRENVAFDSHLISPLNSASTIVVNPLYITSDSSNIYIWRNYNKTRLTNQVAVIDILTSKVLQEYYKASESTATMLVFGDWVFEIENNVIRYYKRQIQGSYIAVNRPTESIPVLSQFSEDIITSFFLDGYYWFITENHIFGTGAANGQITIEFFDPMKYFAVTEKLTAAVRVSDTSFWVFHNDGAYLIYKSTMSTENGTQYVWMCTNTAKSKGCDFKNAIVTLPVTSAVAVVTAEDICSVEMKENIQSDDRTLVPMTLSFRQMVRDLLETTESIKIVTYHYLTIFFLNQNKKDLTMPAVVYDSTIDSWWYWEFPFVQVFNTYQTETNVKVYAEYGSGSRHAVFNFSEDTFVYIVGAIDYVLYADKFFNWSTGLYEPVQIDWEWESAILIFDTVDFRKQLLFTTFVFDDYNIPDDKYANHSVINFEYYFNIYSRKYANTSPQATSTTVYRVTNNACRTMVANFNYLQLILRNRKSTDDREGYDAMNKPKICSISLKYRILRGAIT